MIILEINKQQRLYLSRVWFQRVVDVFYEQSGLNDRYKLSLAFVDNQKIKKLNKVYRDKNKPTDVLSFCEYRDEFFSPEDNFLGEIIISTTQARKQAKEFGHSLKREISRLLIHGLAHLIGYEHENVSIKKAREMDDLEDRIMKKLGF